MFKLFRKEDTPPSYIPAISLGVSIAVIYIALVAHAAATSYKAGYLSHFGIDIRHVNYWPSIADFMNEPLLVVLSILVLLIIGFLTAVTINAIHWILQRIAKKMKWKRFSNFIDEKPYGWKMTTGVLIVLLLFLSFKLPLYDSNTRGIEAAKEQKNFTVLVSENTNKKVLIYQYDGIGLFKTYNTTDKLFDDPYEPLSMIDKELRAVKLIAE